MNVELQKKITPETRELIASSDAYMNALYPPESNHLVAVDSLLSDDFEFYLLRDGAVCVGCIGISFRGPHPELKRMFVGEEHRGRGHGRRLLEFAVDRCVQRGFEKVRLETGVKQPAATALFEKLGFRRIPPFGSYTDDPLSVFYERAVSGSAGA